MGLLIDFLLENFIYVVFISILLVLALIGYIADKTKTQKLRKELTKEEDSSTMNIPLANLDSNVKLGETVNKMASLDAENVNRQDDSIPALKIEDTPER
ncbi:MAG TPA: hypothetical protein DCY94_03050 [Firmicutes bacterium]|nr:hypothetical protein [Bacillota bacterium]